MPDLMSDGDRVPEEGSARSCVLDQGEQHTKVLVELDLKKAKAAGNKREVKRLGDELERYELKIDRLERRA